MIPTLTFHGAARTVTGSAILLDTKRGQILVDCGMFQGSKSLKQLNYGDFPFDPKSVHCVVLTHAHIDHSGLLPKLVKAGFDGPIYATRGTSDLCSIMLPDSGHIQEFEVEILNRRNRRRGRAPVTPIYTAADAADMLPLFRTTDYDSWFDLLEGARARFWNAGHILGSASIEIEIVNAGNNGMPLRIVFSGDLGPDHKSFHPDPDAPTGIDYVICESTYGDTDRKHSTPRLRRDALAAEIKAAYHREGTLIIPAFAVERTQEMLLDLVYLIESGRVPEMIVYVDSPLAIRATRVFAENAKGLEDGPELRKALQSHHLRFAETVEQSKAIAHARGFKVIVSASGMCDAGRIRHHLRRWLWEKSTTVLLVGYQAQGTLGRLLLEGEKSVRIQGDEVRVKARIRSIDDYSGHADGPELAEWINERRPIRRGVFLVHGEEPAMAALKQRLRRMIGEEIPIERPIIDDTYALTPRGPKLLKLEAQRRIEPELVGRLDWHNDLSRLILDIAERLDQEADDKRRAVVIRRIRRALEETG